WTMRGIERPHVESHTRSAFTIAVQREVTTCRSYEYEAGPQHFSIPGLDNGQRGEFIKTLCVRFCIPDRHVQNNHERNGEVGRQSRYDRFQTLWSAGGHAK